MSLEDTAASLRDLAQSIEDATGIQEWTPSYDSEYGWIISSGETWIALVGEGEGIEDLANLISWLGSPFSARNIASWLVAIQSLRDSGVVSDELWELTGQVVADFESQ